MTIFSRVFVLLLPVVLGFGCSTAPVVPEQPAEAENVNPYDTRGSDVYTYELGGDASGRNIGSPGSGASGSSPISARPGAVSGGPGASINERIIYFDFDSAEIRPDARPIVEAHARYLVNNPGAAAILEGHADERGTREYNIGLGERRSDAVRRLMSAYGVGPHQMRVVSYGEERPAMPGHDDGSYARNRRVEIAY